jgi:hypothetical protein
MNFHRSQDGECLEIYLYKAPLYSANKYLQRERVENTLISYNRLVVHCKLIVIITTAAGFKRSDMHFRRTR